MWKSVPDEQWSSLKSLGGINRKPFREQSCDIRRPIRLLKKQRTAGYRVVCSKNRIRSLWGRWTPHRHDAGKFLRFWLRGSRSFMGKFKCTGIADNALDLLGSYLSNRTISPRNFDDRNPDPTTSHPMWCSPRRMFVCSLFLAIHQGSTWSWFRAFPIRCIGRWCEPDTGGDSIQSIPSNSKGISIGVYPSVKLTDFFSGLLRTVWKLTQRNQSSIDSTHQQWTDKCPERPWYIQVSAEGSQIATARVSTRYPPQKNA